MVKLHWLSTWKIHIWTLTSHHSQKPIPDEIRPNENLNRKRNKKPYALNKGRETSTSTGNSEAVIKTKDTLDYINFCVAKISSAKLTEGRFRGNTVLTNHR